MMSGSWRPHQLTLTNGLQVKLLPDTGATRAAALIQLTAGSHDEPDEWPGLAHLLEHVVFSGSVRYQNENRLMAWAQAEGAKLNATTLATTTSWFFDSTAEKLAEGLDRLVDMLAFPLLSRQAIQQEVAVIDAEYRMLASHGETQREAALALAFASPPALQRFHVGDRRHFGDDIDALQRALRQYHQRFFTVPNLTLWLQGPWSLERLIELAEVYGNRFSQGDTTPVTVTEPLRLKAERYYRLRTPGTSRLCLSFPLHPVVPQDCQPLLLLRQLITDEAEGSLLAVLREKDYCDNVQVSLPYRSSDAAIVCITFEVTRPDSALCSAIEGIFTAWLPQLAALSAAQLQHYHQLAGQDFRRLTAIDQLRARAFGFAPTIQHFSAISGSWQRWVRQLSSHNMTRLWLSPEEQGVEVTAQGFTVLLNNRRWPLPQPGVTYPAAGFYAPQQSIAQPPLPSNRVALPHIQPAPGGGTLLLSPIAGALLSPSQAYRIQTSLRTLAGLCKHAGGQLTFAEHQGEWLLQLSASHEVMMTTLAAVIARLSQPTAQQRTQGDRLCQAEHQRAQADIAVRYLLHLLPMVLHGQTDGPAKTPLQRWQATLYGGDSQLCDALARLLSSFPADINPADTTSLLPQPQLPRYPQQTSGSDAAVLLFCPLAEQTAACLTAWRVLAMLFEPRFFQQLRVEKNLGYVVSSRFHQVAGIAGILFVVQSPDASLSAIKAHICTFIDEMEDKIADVEPEVIAEKCSTLLGERNVSNNKPQPELAREHWLQQRSYAPPLSETSIATLTVAALHHYYQRLNQERQRWWWLDNGNDA